MPDQTNKTEQSADVGGQHERLVSCHAGSMYQNGLVLYEGARRDKRVFLAIIQNENLRFDMYCNDVDVIGLFQCRATLRRAENEYRGIRCYEIDNLNVMREVVRVIEAENRAAVCG